MEHHLKEMAKSAPAKSWFCNQIPFYSIADIGGADASVLSYIEENIGRPILGFNYEPNKEYHVAAINKTREKNIYCYNNLASFQKTVACNKIDVVLISSLLHIIGQQNNFTVFAQLFDIIRNADPTYIAIRDMRGPNKDTDTPQDMSEAIIANMDPDIRKKLGNHTSGKRALQMILKYIHKDNIEPEIDKDYFASEWSDVKVALRLLGYTPFKERFYTPKYIRDFAFTTFGLKNLPDTHYKVIYKKNEIY